MLTVDGEKYLREKELAIKYGLSVHWFRKARYEKNSPEFYKLNGKVYYHEKAFDEWLKKSMGLPSVG